MSETIQELKSKVEQADKRIDRQYKLLEQREDYLYASKLDGVLGATSFLVSALYKYSDALEAENAALRAALAFYADELSHMKYFVERNGNWECRTPYIDDNGNRARAALTKGGE